MTARRIGLLDHANAILLTPPDSSRRAHSYVRAMAENYVRPQRIGIGKSVLEVWL
jgi:hypothetical protein